MSEKPNPIITYDGECDLCKASIKFVAKYDPGKKFVFSPFQAVQPGINESPHKIIDPDSVILETGGKRYEKSTAVLRILKEMGFPWNLLYVFIVIPKPVRDYVYDFIALRRNRKKI